MRKPDQMGIWIRWQTVQVKLYFDQVNTDNEVQTNIQQQINTKPPMFWTCERMTIDRIPRDALHARFEGKRNKDRPRMRWIIDNINENIESVGLTLRGAMELTKDRGQWRSFIRTHRRQLAGVKNWWGGGRVVGIQMKVPTFTTLPVALLYRIKEKVFHIIYWLVSSTWSDHNKLCVVTV